MYEQKNRSMRKIPPFAVMWRAKTWKLKYIGVYEDKDVYIPIYDIDATVGIPFVYLYDGITVSIESLFSISDKLIIQ